MSILYTANKNTSSLYIGDIGNYKPEKFKYDYAIAGDVS
jgi:hypothetical protein